jgi:hypothetical protein
MRGPEFRPKFIAISGLLVNAEILARDKQQKRIAKIEGMAFVVDLDVRPLARKSGPERNEEASSSRAV